MTEWTKERITKIRGRIKGGYIGGLMSEKVQLDALSEIERWQELEKERADFLLATIGNRSLEHFMVRWKEINDDNTRLRSLVTELKEDADKWFDAWLNDRIFDCNPDQETAEELHRSLMAKVEEVGK